MSSSSMPLLPPVIPPPSSSEPPYHHFTTPELSITLTSDPLTSLVFSALSDYCLFKSHVPAASASSVPSPVGGLSSFHGVTRSDSFLLPPAPPPSSPLPPPPSSPPAAPTPMRTAYLTYECYPSMCLSELSAIASTLLSPAGPFRCSRVAIAHKLGRCDVGETSVIIVVSSVHRDGCLKGIQEAIDELKRRAPIWKRETYEEEAAPAGEGRVVEEDQQGKRTEVWKVNKEWQGGS